MKFLIVLLIIAICYVTAYTFIKPHVASVENNFTKFSNALDSLGK
jgi:hypothetical protein